MTLGIDLSLLPAPDVISPLDFDSILNAMQADFLLRWPDYSGEEHDPITKVLQVAALRELLVRQNHNEKASQIMLAYAKGANLDGLGALPWLQLIRLVIEPADNSTVPPAPALLESDEAFRKRMLLAYNQLATAGSAGSYEFHALTADGAVKDVGVTSPLPGVVQVAVMSHSGSGVADAGLLATVLTALNAQTVRPISDTVVVQSVAVVNYVISAVLDIYPGTSPQLLLDDVLVAVNQFINVQHQIGYDINVSAVDAALHVPGVQNVAQLSILNDSAVNGVLRNGLHFRDGSILRGQSQAVNDLVIEDHEVAFNTLINIVIGAERV